MTPEMPNMDIQSLVVLLLARWKAQCSGGLVAMTLRSRKRSRDMGNSSYTEAGVWCSN